MKEEAPLLPSAEDMSEEVRPNEPFPMVHDPKIRDDRFDKPEPIPDTILHYRRRISQETSWERFVLQRLIGDLHYVLSLSEGESKVYTFDFKTEEYEYALAELDRKDLRELIELCTQFIKEASCAVEGLRAIRGWGAPAAYTRSEVDACKEAILVSPDNTLEEEEVAELKGKDVFDTYERLYDKEFSERMRGKHFRSSHRRADLFTSIAKRALPDWEVDESQLQFGEVYLFPKNESEDREKDT